jgi:hypothetical protein
MAWAKNDSLDGDGSSTSIDLEAITSYTFNQFLFSDISTAALGSQNNAHRLNNDSGTNYAERSSTNGGADGTRTSEDNLISVPNNEGFEVGYFINISSEEKLFISFVIYFGTAGAGTAPNRKEYAQKWANTSAQISDWNTINETTSENYATTANVSLLGTD